MQLSIIIVNYNVKYYLEQCLLSVIKACVNINTEIIVVDNNSTDGSKAYFQNKFSKVTFIWNNQNVGFGKANNQGVKIATGEYVLFLNPDTIVAENCFTNCLDFFKNNSNCGAIGVRMINGAGEFLKESKRGFPNTLTALYKSLGLANVYPKKFGQYYATHLPETACNKVQVLAGAFMMLNKKAIDATNGFDEDFFMYGEDIDLSYRIKKAGLDNYYLGETTIIHFKGESTKVKSKEYYFNFYNAMKLFVDKHFKGNLLTKSIVHFGILCRKALAQKINNNAAITEVEFNNTLIVGTTDEIDTVKKHIKNKTKSIEVYIEKAIHINKTDLVNITNQNKITDIVFCLSSIATNDVISLMQQLKGKNFAFYDIKANAIIGSNYSNQSGYVITT